MEYNDSLRKMERTLALFHRCQKTLAHCLNRRVVREFQVVDTCHNTWEIVIRCVRMFTGLADDRKHGRQASET